MPRTREGVREYFEYMRPKLAGSEAAQKAMDHLLNADVMLPPMPLGAASRRLVVSKVLRYGTIATMPQWMRKLGGLRQPRIVDVLVTPVLKISFRVVESNSRLKLAVLRLISPMTVPVVEPILRGVAPTNPEVVTPAEARARYGYDRPRDAHLELRARQAARVFGDGRRAQRRGTGRVGADPGGSGVAVASQESPVSRGFLHLPGLARPDKCRKCPLSEARVTEVHSAPGYAA